MRSQSTHSAADEPRVIAALARRLAPGVDTSCITRMREGVSTRVYRIHMDGEVLYARVLPEEVSSFAPEVFAHAVLREQGVKVPAVLYWEHRNPDLACSVMITTEIPGQPLSRTASDLDPRELRSVLEEAGRDLAALNGVPVKGFGWIRRDSPTVTSLAAEHPTARAFALESLDDDLALLGASLLQASEVALIRDALSSPESWRESSQSFLAHGDLDVSHIFVHNARYSGMIDLGEIRGADPFYDLTHFHLHDGETVPAPLLPYLLQGYAAARPLPPNFVARLNLLTVQIALRALARRLRKRLCDDTARHLLGALRQSLTALARLPHGSL